MKKLLILAVAAAFTFGLCSRSQAQLVNATTGFVVAAGVTTNVAATVIPIDCSSQRNMALKWTFNLNGSGTEVIGMRIFPSLDGTVPSAPSLGTGYSLAVAANGTTPVTVQTNFDTLGFRYLYVCYITNGSSGQILTNSLDYYIKRNAP